MQPLNLFPLSAFDWFVLAVVLSSVFVAFRSCLVKTVFSLAGLIAGLLVATSIHSAQLSSLQAYVTFDASTQKMIFLGVVLGVYAASMAVSAFAKRVAVGAGMELADRFVGAGFGLVRGALLGALVLVAVTGLTSHSSVAQGSVLAPYLMEGTQALALMDSSSFSNPADPGKNQVLPALQDALEARNPDAQ